MILLLDLGNTRLKWWLVDGAQVRQQGACEYDALDVLFEDLKCNRFRRILGVTVRSADVNAKIERYVRDHGHVAIEWASSQSANGPLVNGYENPAALGVDRWLNLLGASTYGSHTFAVVSLGTAVTVDIVKNWQHLGGYIAPGFRAFRNGLALSTDRVRVSVTNEMSLAPGSNTDTAVSNAFALMIGGFVGEVARIMGADEMQGGSKFCYITGGDAAKFDHCLLPVARDEQLLIKGLCHYFREPLIDQ